MNRYGGSRPTTSTSTSLETTANVHTKVNGGKRKAEVSPRKMEPAHKKRSALGDLTNAVKKKGVSVLGGKVNDKQHVKLNVLEEAKKLTRSRSKSCIVNEFVKEGTKKPDQQPKHVRKTELELLQLRKDLAEKVNAISKLPVRQTRASRSRSVAVEKIPDEQECSPEPTKRVTRSSHTRVSGALAQLRVRDGSYNSSSTDDEESSVYESAVSTPEKCVSVSKEIEVLQNRKNQEVSQMRKRRIPDGVIDFDAETGNDPFQVGLYAEDIFAYYKRRETRFYMKKYLEQQTELNRNMRSILVDWMVEVQESFELNHETMYLAVKIVDLFLSKEFVKREQLQLVGTTAMYIAAKYDERCPPAIDDFCYICDDAYPQQEVIKMEAVILRTLDFDIGVPLSYRFLRRYSRCAKLDLETLTLARYILEMSLMEYEFIDVKDSMIASSALLLALVMKKVKNPWNKTLIYYSGYSKEDIFDLTHRLHEYISNTPSHLKTIRSKYSHRVFYEAAKVPIPDELKL